MHLIQIQFPIDEHQTLFELVPIQRDKFQSNDINLVPEYRLDDNLLMNPYYVLNTFDEEMV